MRKSKKKNRLSESDMDFIKANCNVMSDARIARLLKSNPNLITYHRFYILKVKKQLYNRPLRNNFNINRDSQIRELNALEELNYNGVMLESVQHRINHLKESIYGN